MTNEEAIEKLKTIIAVDKAISDDKTAITRTRLNL